MRTITDRVLEAADVFGAEADALAASLHGAGNQQQMAGLVDAFLAARAPAATHPCEEIAALVERVAADPAFVRVEVLAREAGTTVRRLQRLFAEHVGVGPKWVVRRYRIYEVAERIAVGTQVDLAAI